MRHNENLTGKAHPLAHATFIISGASVYPEFWTSYFGVRPDREISKGQPFLLPSGKLSPRPGKLGLWAVESRGAVRSDELSPHLQYLKSHLGLPRADLRELLRVRNAKMALWCYWMNDAGNRMPDVPTEFRAMIETMGGRIEIDEYR
jgi:hypothetical protein